MIYKALKKLHIKTACIGILLWILSASASDTAKELGQSNPQIVTTFIVIGALLILPTVLYMVLDYIKERYF